MQKIFSKKFNIVTSNFKKEVKGLMKKYPSIKSDLLLLVALLETNPQKGVSQEYILINYLIITQL